SFWKRQSTSPFSVIHPFSTLISMVSEGTDASQAKRSIAAPAMSSSPRLMSYGSLTSMSSATAFTPFTRAATLSAATFCGKLWTRPVRVTTPAFAATPICPASMLGSQPSSAITDSWSSLSCDICLSLWRGERISSPRELGPGAAERPGEEIAAIDVRVLVGAETPYERHSLLDRLGIYSELTAQEACRAPCMNWRKP